MKLKKYLIAGGNSTLLISGCPFIARDKISKKYLLEVEQVGFVEEKRGVPKLVMMGDELCINGTLALAYSSSSSGKLKTSGIKDRVSYSNSSEKTSISFTLDYYIDKNIIIFEGIGFIYEKNLPEKEKIMQILKDLCEKFSLPAFGLISLKKDVLIPYIYVQKINSLVKKNCLWIRKHSNQHFKRKREYFAANWANHKSEQE